MSLLNEYAVTLKSRAEFQDHFLDVLKQTVTGAIAVGVGGIQIKGTV